MDPTFSRIPEGAIAVTGDRIIALGEKNLLSERYQARKTLSYPNGIIMPGLVNAHTHAAMTCFRGLADDRELMDWLHNYIFPAEAKNVTPELVYWGTLLACVEMIRSGTTTFSDMYMFEDETAGAAKEAGMRCMIGEVLYDFPTPNAASPAHGLAYTRHLLERWQGDPLISVQVTPHSLYTCSREVLLQAKELADAFQVPVATHLLENKQEREELNRRLNGRATSYLDDLGLLNNRFIAFHGVMMDDVDIQLFASRDAKVVHKS